MRAARGGSCILVGRRLGTCFQLPDASGSPGPTLQQSCRTGLPRAPFRPGGAAENSPAIHRWVTWDHPFDPRPGGTLEDPASVFQASLRDALGNVPSAPALKCWAIFNCPTGQKIEDVNSPRLIHRLSDVTDRDRAQRQDIGRVGPAARGHAPTQRGAMPRRQQKSGAMPCVERGWAVQNRRKLLTVLILVLFLVSSTATYVICCCVASWQISPARGGPMSAQGVTT